MCRSQDRIITTSIAKDSCDFSQIVMDHPSMNFQFSVHRVHHENCDLAVKPGFIGGLLEMDKLLLRIGTTVSINSLFIKGLHDHIFI